MFRNLYYEFDVLSRAIRFPNLSHAASHVGLSQPQLSRIVKKIEDSLGVLLLDRAAKRKSGWTEIATEVSLAFLKANRGLEDEITLLTQGKTAPIRIRMGFLEGLTEVAIELANALFENEGLQEIEMDVLDLGPLERKYMKGELDLIFTGREPGSKKLSFVRKLGTQTFSLHHEGSKRMVLSSFEFNSMSQKQRKVLSGKTVLLSNSLAVKRKWIEDHRAEGVLPSKLDLKFEKGASAKTVFLIGSEAFSRELWKRIISYKFKNS